MTPPSAATVQIAGARIDACTFREAVDRIVERARAGGPPSYVVTPNAHHVVMLSESESFRQVYDAAWLSLADGMSIVWAAKLLGTPLPEKVSGSDLFPAVCKRIAGTDLRVFLLGGRPGAADGAASALQARYPGLNVAGTSCPPLGFENDPAESEDVIRTIRAAAPDILFVALGAPKQEYWMQQNCERAGVPVSVGVGGTFEFVAGMVRRAPKWVRNSGLEWLFRTMMEPRRLWKRYAVTNPRFVQLVLEQRARERPSRTAPR